MVELVCKNRPKLTPSRRIFLSLVFSHCVYKCTASFFSPLFATDRHVRLHWQHIRFVRLYMTWVAAAVWPPPVRHPPPPPPHNTPRRALMLRNALHTFLFKQLVLEGGSDDHHAIIVTKGHSSGIYCLLENEDVFPCSTGAKFSYISPAMGYLN